MRSRIISLFVLCLLSSLSISAPGQEKGGRGIPDDVYYLMPSFTKGMIYFTGRAPAQGMLNICAVDNTLRFLDKSGKELVAENADDVFKVVLDSVVFIRDGGVFYRMYPVSDGLGIALRREVRIIRGAKEGAYGTMSQTSSIKQYDVIYSDGVAYDLDKDSDVPFEVSESCSFYKEGKVYPLTKKNLRKCFPERKVEIDAYLKSGRSIPGDLGEACGFISRLESNQPLF